MKRVAILLVVLAAGACSRATVPESGEFRVVPLGGQVRLWDGNSSSVLEETSTVESGIAVETGLNGWAQVQFPGGPSFDLSPGARVLLDEKVSELNRGDMLVRTEGSGLTVRAGDAEVAAQDAIFRLSKDYSLILAVYRGEASLPGTGFPPVEALRQTIVVAGGMPSVSTPLVLDANDPWDAELLGPAIDLGLQLVGMEHGLTRQLQPRGQVDAVLRSLSEGFPPRAITSAITALGDPARAVIAAVIATQVARIDGLTSPRALSRVVDLYVSATRAQWMVVAAQWGLADAAERVLAELGQFATAITRDVAPQVASISTPTGESAVREAPSKGDTPGGTGGDGNNGDNTGGNQGGGDKNVTPEPPPAPPPEPQDGGSEPPPECANELECLGDILPGGPGVPGIRSI